MQIQIKSALLKCWSNLVGIPMSWDLAMYLINYNLQDIKEWCANKAYHVTFSNCSDQSINSVHLKGRVKS